MESGHIVIQYPCYIISYRGYTARIKLESKPYRWYGNTPYYALLVYINKGDRKISPPRPVYMHKSKDSWWGFGKTTIESHNNLIDSTIEETKKYIDKDIRNEIDHHNTFIKGISAAKESAIRDHERDWGM